MKKKFLAGIVIGSLIFGVIGIASAAPVEWELLFDSTAGTVANNSYIFSIDTERKATKTIESSNIIITPYPYPSLFYAEYSEAPGSDLHRLTEN